MKLGDSNSNFKSSFEDKISKLEIVPILNGLKRRTVDSLRGGRANAKIETPGIHLQRSCTKSDAFGGKRRVRARTGKDMRIRGYVCTRWSRLYMPYPYMVCIWVSF